MLSNILQGYKIVSLASNIPGVLTASRFGQLGAWVIKIEPPGGDPMEQMIPPWYAQACKGLEVLRLDLKSEAGKARLCDLLSTADLLLTSSRRAALERLGLSWQILHTNFPNLCKVAMVGYPNPAEDRPGHDLTYQAELGLVNPPELPRTLIADLAGVEHTVANSLALLLARERRGEAGYTEISLFASAEVFAHPYCYGLTTPDGLVGGRLPGYNLYRSQDGWIALAALESHFWERLLLELDLPSSAGYDQLQSVLETRTASYWQGWAQARDLPLVAVRSQPG